MVGRTLGHYRIESKLGEGGMGVVYRAHDEQLDRDVAIKVLPASSFSDPTARTRLLREARAAAALNHPNICTIHEVGEVEGQAYIAMEFVEGQALSARLAEGPLPAEQVLRYGLQLGDALEHAHQRGVVHRDLKSANVILTPEGRVKVLDFGLAKRMSGEQWADAVTKSQETLTALGALVGTVPYMAPEQLLGLPADARSDVWALGVVLYEMAAGERPFQGKTGFELSSAILNKPPRPLAEGTPAALQAVMERCLEKEPGQRYQRGGEVRAALEAVQSGVAVAPAAPRPAKLGRRRALALAAAGVVILAVLVGLDVGGLRERLRGAPGAPQIASLAVLPLENLSGDPGQEYFADGMTEALITDLAQLKGLKRVIARGSVMRYKATKKPLPEIAQELKVDAVITGAVLRSGDRVRVTAQLIYPATGEQLWADRYERDFRDVLTLQNEILNSITGQIKVKLTRQEEGRLAGARPVNPEAYEAYLKGRFHAYKLSREELNTALQYYQLALEKDPNYALAHAGIAEVWLMLGDAGFLPSRETVPKWKAALEKALALDDTLAEAHVSLANLRFLYEWDWASGEREYRRAIQLNPGHANAHFVYSDFLISMGRTEEWQEEIRRTLELDPLNFSFQCFYGWQLVYVGRLDEAIGQFRKVLAAQPDFSSAHMGLWGAFYKKGMYEEALAEAKKFFAVLRDREVVESLDRGYAEAGYRGAMRRAGDALAARSERSHVPGIRIARVYAHAGEKGRALDWLEKAYEQRETPLVHIGVGWDWDSLRAEPRFQELLRRMKLPVNAL